MKLKKSKKKEPSDIVPSTRTTMGDAELLRYLEFHMPKDARIPVLREKLGKD
jgi:hypothetical protein